MLPEISIRELQELAEEWRSNSFPPEHTTPPLQALGVCEEAGELAHAVLKGVQGIRGTEAEHRMAAADAVGDIVLYLTGVCTAMGLDMQTCIEDAWDQVKQRDWSKNKQDGVTG